MSEDPPRWRRAEDPVRLATLGLPAGPLVDRLAKVGIAVDLAAFVVHSRRFDSVGDLTRIGFELDPKLSREEAWAATCAVEALWLRWTPSRVYVEQVLDAWFDLDDRLDGLDDAAAAAAGIAAVALGDRIGGARRLVAEGFAGVAAEVLAAVLRRSATGDEALDAGLRSAADGFLAVIPADERWRALAAARALR